ncbi:MAG: histidine phosphatase family protein [Winogradskyella sp.]|nr:histidine phosphatase family protein [Winogradskyella sp.]
MKTIVLMRHGKSSWEFDVPDRQRPLNRRGNKDVQLVVSHFIQNNFAPKAIFSSPAKRALSTCRTFVQAFNLSENSIKIEEDLYDFGGESVINFIKNLPDSYSDIAIFGHNHAFTSISNIFGSIFIDNLPTSGLVKINFDVNHWREIKSGITEFMLLPKELKE